MRHTYRCILASIAFLQLCHATSIVWVVSATGEYVVLAADSRHFADVRDPRYKNVKSNDKACKVIALDDTLFLNGGAVFIPLYRGEPWNSLQVARQIYSSSKTHEAQPLSIEWGNRALQFFYAQSGSDLQSLADSSQGNIVTGGFINFDKVRNPSSFLQVIRFNSVTRQLSREVRTFIHRQRRSDRSVELQRMYYPVSVDKWFTKSFAGLRCYCERRGLR